MKYQLELGLKEKSIIIQALARAVNDLDESIKEGVPGYHVLHEILDDNYQLLVDFVNIYDAEILKRGVINRMSGKDLVKKCTNGEVEIHTPQ